jgi:hypothetical protein
MTARNPVTCLLICGLFSAVFSSNTQLSRAAQVDDERKAAHSANLGAETYIWSKLTNGLRADLGELFPESSNSLKRAISGQELGRILRFITTTPNDSEIELVNAIVVGDVVVPCLKLFGPISFHRCKFTGNIDFQNSTLHDSLTLSHSAELFFCHVQLSGVRSDT